jgi:type I restriction enzyme R subunit
MTPHDYSEDGLVEKPTLALLESLGYTVADGLSEEGLGRDDQSEVILRHRLAPKLAELNPDLPAVAIEATVEELMRDRSALDRTRANQAVHKLLRDGITVTFTGEDGERVTESVRVIDWITPANNEFLAVSQLWVVGPLHTRRCDIVCFVNGIPFVLLELKASHKTVKQAYNKNLRDYRDTIPQLFIPNVFVLLSTGSETKVGATFADWASGSG